MSFLEADAGDECRCQCLDLLQLLCHAGWVHCLGRRSAVTGRAGIALAVAALIATALSSHALRGAACARNVRSLLQSVPWDRVPVSQEETCVAQRSQNQSSIPSHSYTAIVVLETIT